MWRRLYDKKKSFLRFSFIFKCGLKLYPCFILTNDKTKISKTELQTKYMSGGTCLLYEICDNFIVLSCATHVYKWMDCPY